MSFVEQIEAATKRERTKTGIAPTKPVKATKPRKMAKPFRAKKVNKPDEPYRAEPAHADADEGETQKLRTLTLVKLKRILPEVVDAISRTDPTKRTGETWNDFFAETAPNVMAHLLFDLGEIKMGEIRKMMINFSKRVKR